VVEVDWHTGSVTRNRTLVPDQPARPPARTRLFGRIAANKVTEPVGLAREAGFLPGVGSTATRRLQDGHAGATVIARGQPPGDVR